LYTEVTNLKEAQGGEPGGAGSFPKRSVRQMGGSNKEETQSRRSSVWGQKRKINRRLARRAGAVGVQEQLLKIKCVQEGLGVLGHKELVEDREKKTGWERDLKKAFLSGERQLRSVKTGG